MGQQSRGKTRGEPPTVRRGPFHNRDTEKEMVHGATEQRENAGRGGDPGRRFGVDRSGNGIVDMLMNDLPNRTRHALHDICLQGRLNFCQHPTLSRGCSLFLIPYSRDPQSLPPVDCVIRQFKAPGHTVGGSPGLTTAAPKRDLRFAASKSTRAVPPRGRACAGSRSGLRIVVVGFGFGAGG